MAQRFLTRQRQVIRNLCMTERDSGVAAFAKNAGGRSPAFLANAATHSCWRFAYGHIILRVFYLSSLPTGKRGRGRPKHYPQWRHAFDFSRKSLDRTMPKRSSQYCPTTATV
jgi:hypothetical protein